VVKILHTADIHLKAGNDKRWSALQEIINIGIEEGIDLLIISGDLFDKTCDAERLRPEMHKIFSGTGFETILIPGNHDEKLREGIYLGENVHVLSKSPFDYYDYKDVRIIGLPFKRITSEEVFMMLRTLSNKLEEDKYNILLFHGELADRHFYSEDYGNECERRYMPLKLSYLKNLNVNYVLAGHYHKRFEILRLENGGFFVYPGSPVSITQKEIGQRKVNLFEVGGHPKEHPLNTFHFERVNINLNPLRITNPIEYVNEHLKNIHPMAKVFLTVRGFINSKATGITEKMLKRHIENALEGRYEDLIFKVRDIDIIQDELFERFKERLMRTDSSEEEKELMLELLVDVFTEMI